jgi:hypothetical protein
MLKEEPLEDGGSRGDDGCTRNATSEKTTEMQDGRYN